jgi:hypothetical protein
MLRSLPFPFITLMTLLIAVNALAALPATKPAVPALIVGTPPPKSFVVDGVFRFSGSGGLAFHVATDGERQVCAVYDPTDGTPLFISDGHWTLVYDLSNPRVVRVPNSRGNVRVDWDVKKEKPLGFGFAVDFKSNPAKLNEANAWFRVDRFVDATAAATALKRVGEKENVDLFEAERQGGTVESLQIDRANASWFRFSSKIRGEDYYKLELDATKIGQPLPDGALAFPDVQRLPPSVHLTELDQQMSPAFLVSLRDGRAWMAKLAIAGGPTVRESADKMLLNADWDELRKRDSRFGAAYRAALAEQGVQLRVYPRAATTRPSS